MQLIDGRLLLSPSDVSAYLECEHLATLELARARGALPPFERPDAAQAELVRAKGLEHEAAHLAWLRAQGLRVVEVDGGGERDLHAAAAATREAMRAGADVVYQAALLDGDWRGLADFLLRVPGGSDLGDWHYEPADTKLARHVRPYHLLQLCFYAHALGRVQGRDPERVHVVLGSGERESHRLADHAAYYRRVRARFAEFLAAEPPTYPAPTARCPICEYRDLCAQRRVADDHLTLVAGLRRDQVRRLEERGVATLAALARAPAEARPPSMAPRTFEGLRAQARLQLAARETHSHTTELLPPEPLRGFALLPRPSAGDLFFDLEGDPFWAPEHGLEYLWGVVDADRRFTAFWAHDEEEERRALVDFVAFVRARLERDPHLHVYHYAAYEPAALKRLMGRYATCEDEVDDLLRRETFVDLYAVVRQALRASFGDYSLKSIEQLYRRREGELRAGDDSILVYERWREERRPELLREIAAYNEEDCRSTLELRDWLLGLREQAERELGPIVWAEAPEPAEASDAAAETVALRARLEALGREDAALAARLLDYHRREAKPVWWAFFDRRGASPEELVERDGDAIGDLTLLAREPQPHGERLTFLFPAQQHRLAPGDEVYDPNGLEPAGRIEELDDDRGRLVLHRPASRLEQALPRSLIPGGPYRTDAQRAALRRVGASLAAGGGAYPAVERLLRREPPRVRGLVPGAPLPQDSPVALAAELDDSHLVVQGPPGSGKTWTGARMVVELIRAGRRVGVTATSHKAIHNLLDEVERVALEKGVEFRGLKKGEPYAGRLVATSQDQERFARPDDDVLLLAGTSWLFAREDMESARIDTLFVDEAGQVSLADAVATAACARNVVLLGDPQQLPHVSQGMHPDGAGVSALEHLLGEARTVPPEAGLFLDRTWRMHGDVCSFVSEIAYEGRLRPAPPCDRQATSLGTGLRFLPVAHAGNRVSSPEEADAVAALVEELLAATWTSARGETLPLRERDVLVVAPYNAQVRCLRTRLAGGVRVGTVDRFQGQEAPVVVFSLATSSGEDLPRNLEFLFSRNRLNVAVSRARCLACLVASPRLLETRCRTVPQMAMVNALCRFVELARPV